MAVMEIEKDEKVLFLADRNILVDKPCNDFRPFGM